ncbi:MAG: transporter substrate-binding domain-containing protein [Deltaproteobacteria bacterium]|nr:transporter substrate-binding domain-containing protein [Deltaproteobacteria bacterium]
MTALAVHAVTGTTEVLFTEPEIAWLKKHPVITAAPDPDFPPVEFFDNQGAYRGIAADTIALIEKKLGIRFNIIRLKNWDEVLEYARAGKIDMITAATPTPQRRAYLRFTESIVDLPSVIIVRQSVKQNLSMADLKGMKIAVVNQYAFHDFMINNHPDIELNPVADTQTGLRMVSFGMVDAMVGNIATASYNIEKEKITNLRIAGRSEFIYNLAFAPLKGIPELHGILQKGLSLITAREKEKIYSKWIKLEQISPFNSRKFWIGLIAAAVCVMLAIAGVLIWNRSLQRLVKQRTNALEVQVKKHQAAKQVIVEKETRYRNIMENTINGVAVFKSENNGKNFVFVDFNKAGEHIDNIKREDLIGRNVLDIFPGMKAAGLYEMMTRVWSTGEAEHYSTTYYQDNRISGWRECFFYKLPSREIVMVYTDKTKRKLAERALRESEEKLAGIINAVNDLLVIVDGHLEIIWANPIAKRLFGPDMVGKTCCTIFADHGERCEGCSVEKSLADGKMYDHECQVVTDDGKVVEFWATSSSAALDNDGQPKTVVMILRDVTEKKVLAAETLRAGHLAAIGELAAGVAHEINNPINSVINLAQILSNESENGSFTGDIAGRMLKESNRIADIVSSLLAFARDRKKRKCPISIAETLDETLAITEVQIRKDGILLDIDLDHGLPPVVGQMQQIQQVFLNLINNARYALNQKFPDADDQKCMTISGHCISENGLQFVQLTFTDTGIGITRDLLPHVMKPFFTSKPSGVGTGLGLSISHGIVTDHGGKMDISSVTDEFTRITVTLPVASGQ